MPKEKKVTIRHFINTKLAPIDIEASIGSYSYYPQYFRITYNRKTSSFKSIFIENVFDVYKTFLDKAVLTDRPTHKRKSIEEISKGWDQVLETILNRDIGIIDLTVQIVISDLGYFDFELFKSYYHEYSKNFLFFLDGSIISEICDGIEDLKLPGTVKVLTTYEIDQHLNVSLHSSEHTKASTPHFEDIVKMLGELNIEVKKKVVNDRVKLMIKAHALLSEAFKVDLEKKSIIFSYLPVVFFLADNGKIDVFQILSDGFTDQEIKQFMNEVNYIFSNPFNKIGLNV